MRTIKGLGEIINDVAQGLGGWKTTLELLLGLAGAELAQPDCNGVWAACRFYCNHRRRWTGVGRAVRYWRWRFDCVKQAVSR